MRTYQITQYGDVGGLLLSELPDPQPGPGEVLIRVRACSLNYRDLIVLRGQYGPKPRPNLVPLSDGAGEIVAVGDGVTHLSIGERVAGMFFQTWQDGPIRPEVHDSALGGAQNGMLSELVVLSAQGVVKLPDYLSYEEAACLPCAGVTSWNGLFEQGRLQAGETVLLLGTGGVSTISLMLAKMAGAKVIITSSSDEKLERAKFLGADEVINYKSVPDWERRVWELTDKRGVDHIIEVGGAGTLEKSLAALRTGGHLALTGVLSGQGGTINPMQILYKSLRVSGIYVGSRAMFESLLRAMEQNKVRPVVDRVFSLENTPDAYTYLQSGAHFGKVVISL